MVFHIHLTTHHDLANPEGSAGKQDRLQAIEKQLHSIVGVVLQLVHSETTMRQTVQDLSNALDELYSAVDELKTAHSSNNDDPDIQALTDKVKSKIADVKAALPPPTNPQTNPTGTVDTGVNVAPVTPPDTTQPAPGQFNPAG
jgi:uncharacterized membrane protein YdfJ with MMPL/SSD domain